MSAKAISPAALLALKEALTSVYWYKSDLRSFLTNCLSNPKILMRVNWDDYKHNIVSTLVDELSKQQSQHLPDLLRLVTEVTRITDFSHLERLEDGASKSKRAREAVAALRKLSTGHATLADEQNKAEERRLHAREKLQRTTEAKAQTARLATEYSKLVGSNEPQNRGYVLERIIRELFTIFDLDPKASFKIAGEQIDGAFTFQGTDYLFEAKWQKELADAAQLDSLAGKLSRKLDNTLGLFLSINGFSESAVTAHSSGRSVMLLMDGSELMAILEGRIDLIEVLLRKRRHAAQTGNIYLRVQDLL